MKQGDVYWYTFREPDKRRPVVVLTRSNIIPRLGNVTVVPVTSTVRGIGSEVVVGPDDGLPEISAINLDNIITVAKDRFGPYLAHLSPTKLQDVGKALLFSLDVATLLGEPPANENNAS